MTCLSCSTQNPAGAKFCLNCGRALARPVSDEGVPVGEGERRVVTILFCDVKGSTALAERLDPEEWTDIMNGAFACLTAPVVRYGGNVARLMGDAILAFFGAPTAHEDDPQRAVLAGLAIVDEIHAYRSRIGGEHPLEFDVRVGINTGLVVVGEVGSSARTEYTAMGDAANLAARMEQTAPPGTVQISEHTFSFVSRQFHCVALGNLAIKGKSEAVAAYRVVGPRERPGDRRGLTVHNGALVGRERELSRLGDALAGTRAGRGRVICLIGEAGLGKSRLIQEGRALWVGKQTSDPNDVSSHWAVSRALSYETLQPFGQFRQLLRTILDVAERAEPEAVMDKVAGAVSEFLPDRRGQLERALGALLGVDRSEDRSPIDGDLARGDLIDALSLVLRRWARATPAVLVFDDLHWADPASVELLGHLVGLVEDAPMTFLCAFRPDPAAPSARVVDRARIVVPDRIVEIKLEPLPDEESAALLAHLLGTVDLSDRLRNVAVARADGNPFFLEELVRSLRDQTDSSDDLAGSTVPHNVRGLLLARIDRLPRDARHVLELAAVVGRSFTVDLLDQMVRSSVNLDEQIAILVDLGLIVGGQRGGVREYTFRHGLTRDAAYESMLWKRRRALHRRVGEAIERRKRGRVDDDAALLAHHYGEAGDARAGYYAILAGDVAYRLDAHIEAAEHYRRAVAQAKRSLGDLEDLADRTGRTPAGLLRHLRLRLGRAFELGGRYADAIESYQALGASAPDDPSALLAALMAEATVYATPNPAFDPVKGKQLLDDCLVRARLLSDRQSESRILWSLLLLHTYTFDMTRAIEYGEEGLSLARELGASEQLAFTLNDLHRAYLFRGRGDRARVLLDEAQALWRELANGPMLVDNLASQAYLDYLDGRYDEAIRASAEANRLSRAADNDWGRAFSQMIVGQIFFDRGEVERALETMEDAIRMGERSGHPMVLTGTRAQLAYVYGALGAVDRGIAIARQGIAAAEKGFRILLPLPLAALARLQLLAGQTVEAQETVRGCRAELRRDGSLVTPLWVLIADGEVAIALQEFDRADAIAVELLEYLRDFQTHSGTAEALLLAGRAELGRGYLDQAREHLFQARTEAEALGTRMTLWPILTALAELANRQGEEERAKILYLEAGAIVDDIAARVTAAERRASFLESPIVRKLRRSAHLD